MVETLTQELAAFRDLLAELVEIPAVHCHEEPMMVVFRDRMAPLADEVKVDMRGNVYAIFEGTPGAARTLMLAAHLDAIGLVVRFIDEKGFVRFEGNADGMWLQSRKVWLHGSKGPALGVTSVKVGYGVTPAEERGKAPELRDMHIDVGCRSRAEVEALGIGVGDPITFDGRLETLGNPFHVAGPALDNRAGVAALLTLAGQIKKTEPRPRVVLVGTVEEEIGTKGAAVAAAVVAPDAAISVDTQPAAGTPGVPEHVLPLDIGKGPVLKFHEGRFVTLVHPRMRQLLVDAARNTRTPFQLAGAPPGNSDLNSMQQSGLGVPSGAIGIPRRYAHSPNELIDLRDAFGVVAVLREALRLFGAGHRLERI